MSGIEKKQLGMPADSYVGTCPLVQLHCGKFIDDIFL